MRQKTFREECDLRRVDELEVLVKENIQDEKVLSEANWKLNSIKVMIGNFYYEQSLTCEERTLRRVARSQPKTSGIDLD